MAPLLVEVPLQPKQLELLRLVEESPASWIAYGGSRGGAKSHGLRAVMLLRRLKHHGTRGLIFRKTFEQLWQNHVQPLFDQYPFMRNWYHTGHRELTLPNGSVIVFGYAEHPGDITALQGQQFMDIGVDEATHLSEAELVFLRTCNRWPGKGDNECKMILTCNPGGVGHAFVKTRFFDKQYKGNENPDDYVFLQSRAWDNSLWARAALAEANLTDKDYYAWSDEQRFKFFIEKTDYGRTLNALPQALKIGHLLGSWNRFAGQYYDLFDPAKHVKPCKDLDYWTPRWLGIDWGRTHNAVCLWNAQVERITKTYREMAVAGRSPKALAEEIVDRTPEDERKHVDAIYLSHDAFAERTSPDTIALQMGEVFRRYGMPEPIKADKDVAGSAMLLYELLRSEQWEIDPSCEELIKCLPMVTRDEEEWEKPVKFDGDDPYEAARYSLKMRLRGGQAPKAERIQEKIEAAELTDLTQINIWRSKFAKQEERKSQPVKFGRRHINHRQRMPI